MVLASTILVANGPSYSPAVGPLALNEHVSSVVEHLGAGLKRNRCFGDANVRGCDYELVYSDSRNLLIVTVGAESVMGVTLLKNAAKRYEIAKNTIRSIDFGSWTWEGGKVFPLKPPRDMANWQLRVSEDGLDYMYQRFAFSVLITKDRFAMAED